MFENKRYITRGVSQKVDLRLQLFMWQCIDRMDVPKDYLQIFTCSMSGTKQKMEHMQEEPAYKREYLFLADAPIFVGKIFVIGMEHTMLMWQDMQKPLH